MRRRRIWYSSDAQIILLASFIDLSCSASNSGHGLRPRFPRDGTDGKDRQAETDGPPFPFHGHHIRYFCFFGF